MQKFVEDQPIINQAKNYSDRESTILVILCLYYRFKKFLSWILYVTFMFKVELGTDNRGRTDEQLK